MEDSEQKGLEEAPSDALARAGLSEVEIFVQGLEWDGSRVLQRWLHF